MGNKLFGNRKGSHAKKSAQAKPAFVPSVEEMQKAPLPKNTQENMPKASTYEETRDLLAEYWAESVILPFLDNKNVVAIAETSNSDMKKDYIAEYIGSKVDNMAKSGFRSVFTGKEIINAVKEKQDRLFMDVVLDVTETMLFSALGKMKEKSEKRPIDFDEFIFLSLARNDFGIAKEAFSGVLATSKTTKIAFLDKNLPDVLGLVLAENEDKSGLDGLTQLYFDVFKKKNTVRENINIPIPEHIVGVEVK